MATIFNRDILLASSRKTVKVDVPELDCEIILKELSVAQLNSIDKDATKQLAMMIVDAEGNRVFETEEDVRALSELSATIFMRLMTAAAKLNGIGQAAIDESIKNLLTTQKDGSNTA